MFPLSKFQREKDAEKGRESQFRIRIDQIASVQFYIEERNRKKYSPRIKEH